MTWTGKIINDSGKRVFPSVELGSAINSAAIPKLPNAQLVICIFDPLYKVRTLGHSMVSKKDMHETPKFTARRAIYTEIKVNGITKFTSPVTIHDTFLDVGFANKNPIAQDFSGLNVDVRAIEDAFQPDMMPPFGSNISVPTDIVQPWVRQITVAFSIGDGTNVVESMRNAVQRIAFKTNVITQTLNKVGNVVEKFEDLVAGDLQVQVWGN